VEVLKEETQKLLKELQENTKEQGMELNKTIQDLKREVEAIEKTQSEITLEIESLGKKSVTIDVNISNRIYEKEERISDAEVSIENIVIKKDREGHFILIKSKIYQDEHSILNIYAPHNNQRKYKMQKDPNSKHS
jgi:predicted  nucleic acid-binding Zn-ribbon protein